MSHVFRSGVINASAAEVCKVVGSFDSIHAWNPSITRCRTETTNGVECRYLTFEDGAELKETSTGVDGTSTGYRGVETALPLNGYVGAISVVDQGTTSLLCWSSSFTTDQPRMAEGVGEIYQAGIDAVAAKFA